MHWGSKILLYSPQREDISITKPLFIAEGEALLEWPAYCITFSLATTGIEISNISTSCPACSLKFSAKFPRSPSVFDPSSTTVYRLTILKLKKKIKSSFSYEKLFADQVF